MPAPRINMEVSLGHIIQMCVIVGGGLILYGRGDERAASTAAAVAGFDVRLTRELAEVRGSIDSLRVIVNPIGALNTRLAEVERRLTEQDTRDNDQDRRLGAQAEAIATLRARVEFVAQPGRRVVP
ncbi:hypothetical protein [Roseococcus pinisoli]|uniref:Uncharacterized protein n=1 Tax=Roseococcus pinisoli TaxID=2835040 RepID=A0ABS5QA05_9PROT|nr:hypothetical protein [Roseococcus pinisoli]MBS7810544.1 hypothetical protein [Roseococcus pinisoli]